MMWMFKHAAAFVVVLCMLATPGSATEGDLARNILEATGTKGGLVVHLGCGNGKLTAALCADDSYVVHGLDKDVGDVDRARKYH